MIFEVKPNLINNNNKCSRGELKDCPVIMYSHTPSISELGNGERVSNQRLWIVQVV
jgi:hypothetical protein